MTSSSRDITVRLPAELREELGRRAELEHRSVSSLAAHLIARGIAGETELERLVRELHAEIIEAGR